MSDETPITGPRRYHVLVDVGADAVGPLFALLISEVEQPKMEPGENGAHRVSLVCMQDQLTKVIGIIADPAIKLWIKPYNPEVKLGPATFIPPKSLRNVVTPLQKEITVLPPQKRREYGVINTVAKSPAGSLVMALFKDGRRVLSRPDAVEALCNAGYQGQGSASNVLSSMVLEGSLVRVGRGLYRLPSTTDYNEVQKSFSDEGSSE